MKALASYDVSDINFVLCKPQALLLVHSVMGSFTIWDQHLQKLAYTLRAITAPEFAYLLGSTIYTFSLASVDFL